MAKLLKITGYTLALLLLAAFAFTRITGAMIVGAGGKALGYSKHTHEWLLGDYPTFAARRDGPYVLDAPTADDGARRIALSLVPRPDAETVAVRTPVTAQVEVVVDDATATRFSVPLRDRHPRPPVRWPMPDELLAVSDLEGNFAAATALLRAQGVIDADLHWRFGKGQLVLLGDMVDRGDNVVPLLWLLYRLDAEARAAGGALHYLLGNHEQYLLQGRPKSAHRKYFGTARVAGVDYGDLWSERSELGRWLRSKPMLVKIGDTLFVHGGISPQVLATGLDLAAIDALAARHADDTRPTDDADGLAVIQDRNGLAWYRGLARGDEETPMASDAHIDAMLAHFGARRIAIGHTLATHVGYTYGGRVLRTDVHHAGGTSEAILFADGALWRVDAAGTRVPLAATNNLRD